MVFLIAVKKKSFLSKIPLPISFGMYYVVTRVTINVMNDRIPIGEVRCTSTCTYITQSLSVVNLVHVLTTLIP